MPTYTTLTTGPRTRVLRLSPNGAAPVTSLPDPTQANELAQALTVAGADLPGLVTTVLHQTGVWLPEPTLWEYHDGVGRGDWLNEPAPTNVVDTTRRTLAALAGPNPPVCLEPLARALRQLPEPVARAVRDEVAAVLSPYDDVPVVAHVYDHKWNDASWSVLVTGALNTAAREVVERVVTFHAGELLDILADQGDVEVPDAVTAAADQGYLTVALHPAQLRAWLHRHHPDLVARVPAS